MPPDQAIIQIITNYPDYDQHLLLSVAAHSRFELLQAHQGDEFLLFAGHIPDFATFCFNFYQYSPIQLQTALKNQLL